MGRSHAHDSGKVLGSRGLPLAEEDFGLAESRQGGGG